ncbi:MAG: hypothetical protein AB2826_24945, partial [Candidatus Thiodiazotropha sp.]
MRNTEIFTSRCTAIFATTAISSKPTDREGGKKSRGMPDLDRLSLFIFKSGSFGGGVYASGYSHLES